MTLKLSRRRFLTHTSTLIGLSQIGLISTRFALANFARPRLPIPRLEDGTSGKPIDLRIQTANWSFLPGIQTPTLGISQNYLAPTLRTRRGSELNLHYENAIDENVAIHGHGLHVPGEVDGGPQLQMMPGDKWQPSLSIIQPAATCWYHSHTHGRTAHQVYHGLAGMIIIDDDDADALGLPSQYGIDDLPVIIQDRTFDDNGRLVYSLEEADDDGWYGDTVTINGAISPVAKVPAGKVRLRLLNGANARFYIIAFADDRTFHLVASDGGLLEEPVEMSTLEMAPGERCEIIVDLSDGNPAGLLTLFEDEVDVGGVGEILNWITGSGRTPPEPALLLEVNPTLTPSLNKLPEKMAKIVRPDEAQILGTRDFVLDMDGPETKGHDHGNHSGETMTINGAVMDMSVINERVKKGVWERWRVQSNQGEHPFHVHGCSFLVEKIAGEAAPAHQQGWKDTVVLDDDGWSEFVVKFDHVATEKHPYMYHCHILEHEDHGMMGQFTVT